MASTNTERLPVISRSFVTTRGVGFDLETPAGVSIAGASRRARPGGVETVVGPQTRRTLLGMGTYLIDTPRDSGLHMRQQFFSHQELHRGVVRSQDEMLPEIPYRLHPRPDPAHSPPTDTYPRATMVDAATSPVTPLDEGSDHVTPSRASSPILPPSRSVTFVTNREVTSHGIMTGNDNGRGSWKNQGTSTARFSKEGNEFRQRRNSKVSRQSERELSRDCSTQSEVSNLQDNQFDHVGSHVSGRLPKLPLTERSATTSLKKSSSVTDLTDVCSTFSLRDRDYELKTYRSFDLNSEHIGPTSYLQRAKSKSLADLLKPSKGDSSIGSDLAAYHKRQRIAQLAFCMKRNSTMSSDDANKEWLDMRNTQIVDKTEYDRFASRRKPPQSSRGWKKSKKGKSFSPRSGQRDFQLTHPVKGKVYPVFTNDGSPVRKFGRVTSKRKQSKR